MARREDDDASILTIKLDSLPETSKRKAGPLSQAKLDQLADAREKSLHSRRLKMKLKLEQKLGELHEVMGDLRSDQLEKVARAMMEQEARLRAKQAAMTDALATQVRGLHDELRTALQGDRPRSSASSVASSRQL